MRKIWLLFIAALFAAVLIGCSDNKEKNSGGNQLQSGVIFELTGSEYDDASLQDLKYSNGRIYAALYFLDAFYQPSAKSKILEIDEMTHEILRVFESNFMNVIDIAIRGNYLYVLDMGNYYAVNGGITRINLTSGEKSTIFDGAQYGADPQKIEFVSDNEAYLLMCDDFLETHIASFDLTSNTVSPVTALSDYEMIQDISYNQTTNTLWFGDYLSEVHKYSPSSGSVTSFRATMPVASIKSVGAATVTVESNWSAGAYGVIKSDRYYNLATIASDAGLGFAEGNFYILERLGSGGYIELDAAGQIIDQISFAFSPYYNPHGVCGNGKGNIFIGSLGELSISAFEANSGF